MGSFAIWHWAIMLLIVLPLPILTILLSSQEKTLTRSSFAVRWAILFAVAVGLMLLSALIAFFMIGVLIVNVLFIIAIVHRLNDAGLNRWIALLTGLPPLNLLLAIALLFIPSREAVTQAA